MYDYPQIWNSLAQQATSPAVLAHRGILTAISAALPHLYSLSLAIHVLHEVCNFYFKVSGKK